MFSILSTKLAAKTCPEEKD